jgi:hypothetical protein
VPIFADESVLDRAGVLMDDETGDGSEEHPEGAGKVNPEELERLGAFKDFIEGLDLSDFDKPRR